MYNVLYLKPNVNSFELLQGVTGCCGRNITGWMDVVTDNALSVSCLGKIALEFITIVAKTLKST